MRLAFTLIELLVVIAIIAILSIVVILVLNPAQLLQQARDSTRISDMSILNTALGVYQAQGGGSLGSSSVVYVSIPDPTAATTSGDACQGLNLISLPAAYVYHCAASSTYRAVDGTGWIPVNFASISSGAPIGQLPVDPVNTSSSRLYYTYTTNGMQYETTMVPESQKYQLGGNNDVIANDGGILASVYERGTAYGLEPLDYGDNTLIAYWPLNEGAGLTAYDYSGSNVTGTWNGTPTGTNNSYYATGKGRGYQYAGDFDGSTNYITAAALNIFNEHAFTVTGWIYPTVSKEDEGLFGACQSSTTDHCLHLAIRTGSPYMGFFGDDISGGSTVVNAWYDLAFTYTGGAGGTRSIYLNGVQVASGTSAAGLEVTNGTISDIGTDVIEGDDQGLIDGVRVYNRVLSAAQIAAMYAGGK